MCSAFRFCFSVYFDLSPLGMVSPLEFGVQMGCRLAAYEPAWTIVFALIADRPRSMMVVR
jgi:hypothetical protein